MKLQINTINQEIPTLEQDWMYFCSLAEKYFNACFGTFHFYEKSIWTQNCTDMALCIVSDLKKKWFDAHIGSMFSDTSQDTLKNPNHVVAFLKYYSYNILFEPTLFLETPVLLPQYIWDCVVYKTKWVEWIKQYFYKYTKTDHHFYRREQYEQENHIWVNNPLKQDILCDRVISQEQLVRIRSIQDILRSDIKIGQVVKITSEAIIKDLYCKIKYDSKTQKIILFVWENKTSFWCNELKTHMPQIKEIFPWLSDAQLFKAISIFSWSKNIMSSFPSDTSEIFIDWIHAKLIPAQNNCFFRYMHGLYGSIDSAKSKAIMNYAQDKWYGGISMSFSWNGESKNIAFEQMNLQTMAEDIHKIFSWFMKEYPTQKIIPIASSLWASALVYAFKLYPELLDYCQTLVFLAPSLEFAKNRKRMRSEKEDRDSLKKRTDQWYLIEHNNTDWKYDKLSYTLFQQSDTVDLIYTLRETNKDIVIFAWLNDELIPCESIKKIAIWKDNIKTIRLADNHQLSSSLNTIFSQLDELF